MTDFDDLAVEDISRHFGRRRALSRITFHAGRHTILGLLGPNGAGTSTMLALLATLLRPSGGRIRYGSHEAGEPAATLRAAIGVLGHDLFLYPELTALENLAFFAALHGISAAPAAALAALERAGLADRADDPVSSFSRGMRQRVALLHGPHAGCARDSLSGASALARLHWFDPRPGCLPRHALLPRTDHVEADVSQIRSDRRLIFVNCGRVRPPTGLPRAGEARCVADPAVKFRSSSRRAATARN